MPSITISYIFESAHLCLIDTLYVYDPTFIYFNYNNPFQDNQDDAASQNYVIQQPGYENRSSRNLNRGSRKMSKIYLTDSNIYIVKGETINKKIPYKEITSLWVAIYSSELLIVSESLRVLIDSMQYRPSIVRIACKHNNNVHVHNVHKTTLDSGLYEELIDERLKWEQQTVRFNLVEERKKLKDEEKMLDRSYQLKNYKFISLIASNEFWELYQTTNCSSDKKRSSLKVYLKQTVQKFPNLLKFILTERTHSSMLTTAYSPQLIKAFETHSHLCLEYEYFTGVSLHHLKPIAGNKLCRLISEIVVAIGQVHESGLVYMDLSPGSFMLAHDGHILLTNIGMTSQIGQSFEIPVINFCSPETISRTSSHPSMDWWGLGALIVFLVTRQSLYPSLNEQAVKEKLTSQDQLNLRSLMDEKTDPKLFNLTEMLLTKKTEERLGSKYDYHEVISHAYFGDLKKKEIMMRQSKQILKMDIKVNSASIVNPIENMAQIITLQKQALRDFHYNKEIEDET